MSNLRFNSAQAAFEYWYQTLMAEPEVNGTKSLDNIGFWLIHPSQNQIFTSWRKWKLSYAEAEWQWYLSGTRSVEIIKTRAKMWGQLADALGEVNSNYGWHWRRSDQLTKAVDLLRQDPHTRRASISIFDGKECDYYGKDVPCTYAVNFTIRASRLNMSVMMRSNDLWLGFCNDQYCFSKLQRLVAGDLGLPVGEYFHFTNNLHLYAKHFNMDQPVSASTRAVV